MTLGRTLPPNPPGFPSRVRISPDANTTTPAAEESPEVSQTPPTGVARSTGAEKQAKRAAHQQQMEEDAAAAAAAAAAAEAAAAPGGDAADDAANQGKHAVHA
jgi:hypothetical protein